MDRKVEIDLAILEEISKDGNITQRSLAQKLNVALGLCNMYVKRLVEKGHLMVSTMPRHRLYYNLTPTGLSEKTRLTLLYMRDSLDYYKRLKQMIQKTLSDLHVQGVRKIALLGTGELAEILYIFLAEFEMELVAVTELSPKKARFLGLEVFGAERLARGDYDRIIIVEDLPADMTPIVQMIQSHNIPIEKIVHFTGHTLKFSYSLELNMPKDAAANGSDE